MAQNEAVIVFCASCKILYFAISVHPKIATGLFSSLQLYCGSNKQKIKTALLIQVNKVENKVSPKNIVHLHQNSKDGGKFNRWTASLLKL